MPAPDDKHTPPTLLHETRFYAGKLFQVDVLDVRLPRGREAKREIVRHPGAVAMVVVDPEERVLLVRQYRAAAGRVLLEIPAGTREKDEDAEACARREVQEETGYAAGRVESLGGFFSAPGFCTEYLYCFLCTDLHESRLPGDEDEDIELVRLTLDEAWAAAASGEITDAKTLAGLALYSSRALRSK
jgi:ADP-ribose pyrophosphatase